MSCFKLEPVTYPMRQLAFVVTHENLGDGYFAPLVAEAFTEMFEADKGGSQMNFEATNGVKIQIVRAKGYVPQIGETPEDAV